MEMKQFVVNKVTDYGDFEAKETYCVFHGSQKEVDEIVEKYNNQKFGYHDVWLEIEEEPTVSDVNEVLEICGYIFPMQKTLFVYFFRESDGVYVYKRRPDRTEEQAKPVVQKVSSVGFEFANTLRGLKRNGIDKDTGKKVEWNVVVHYRRADNIVDVEEFKQIVRDVEFKDKLEFRSE